ncbi:hypothetical protein ACAS46_004455 [Vibrio vulnificus]
METVLKFFGIKNSVQHLIVPLLTVSYLSYFPASLAQGSDIAYLYNMAPLLGELANLLLAMIIALVSYSIVFELANYLDSYHSIPMFLLLAIAFLALSFSSIFDVIGFQWINQPLAYAFLSLSISFLSLLERTNENF